MDGKSSAPSSPVALLERDNGEADDLHHYYCCDPNVAICGLDLSGVEETCMPECGYVCPLCDLSLEKDWPCPVAGCRGR